MSDAAQEQAEQIVETWADTSLVALRPRERSALVSAISTAIEKTSEREKQIRIALYTLSSVHSNVNAMRNYAKQRLVDVYGDEAKERLKQITRKEIELE